MTCKDRWQPDENWLKDFMERTGRGVKGETAPTLAAEDATTAAMSIPFGVPITLRVEPIGKPRMTRRDTWKKRPAVLRYRAFADAVREQMGMSAKLPSAPIEVSWTAYFPIPISWKKSEKLAARGQYHTAKPDRDNVDKALLDSLFEDDSSVATGKLEKRWDDGDGARIVIIFGQPK